MNYQNWLKRELNMKTTKEIFGKDTSSTVFPLTKIPRQGTRFLISVMS